VITPDFYASQSRLRLIDPGLKLFVALPLLGICLWADSIVLSIAILIFTGSILVKGGGVPLRIYMKLVFLPISFFAGNRHHCFGHIGYAGAFLFFILCFREVCWLY